MSIESVLSAIEAADTAGKAIDAIPEEWQFFLSGPEIDGFAFSILPRAMMGAPERTYGRGLAMGRGATRLEAIRAGVAWLRDRMPRETREIAA